MKTTYSNTNSKIIASSTRILELYLSGFDFSALPEIVKSFSQLKSGEARLVSGVLFKKQGRDLVLVSVQRKRAETLSKQLLFTLIGMLSCGHTAQSITTIKST